VSLKSINPAIGEVLREYEPHTEQEVDSLIEASAAAADAWSGIAVCDRAALMGRAGEVLEQAKDVFGELITREMGKPLAQSVAEIEKCAWVCRYYADNGERFLQDELLEANAGKSFVAFEPLGLVLAVMPWNFPFWQVFRFAAPALVAGNGALLKHASNVSGCALAIEQVFAEAGFPEGLFRTLLIPSSEVDRVIGNQLVKAVTLTGSEPAGRSVAACAGRHLKKTVLELGGSDPYIILEDADLDLAAEKCLASRLNNCGQTCIAAKRFIVVSEVRQAFTQRLINGMQRMKTGDPMSEETDLGPLAREDLREDLHRQVSASLEAGAQLLYKGELPTGLEKGSFYPPVLLADVGPGMPVYKEETFGPVAAVIAARDEDDAIRIANDSNFGLGAAVFTRDTTRGERVARQLQAGCVFVNDFVKSDPRLPFGGVKRSGYGRELSRYGMLELRNLKTVSVSLSHLFSG
jgi:succinate-semialdehyde dehydrogenase/glutarate-semialdehyde dehydrogenase